MADGGNIIPTSVLLAIKAHNKTMKDKRESGQSEQSEREVEISEERNQPLVAVDMNNNTVEPDGIDIIMMAFQVRMEEETSKGKAEYKEGHQSPPPSPPTLLFTPPLPATSTPILLATPPHSPESNPSSVTPLEIETESESEIEEIRSEKSEMLPASPDPSGSSSRSHSSSSPSV